MDDYTKRTKAFLEQRFKDADRQGAYRSHAPIYGFSREHIFLGLYKNNYTVLKEIEKVISQYSINSFLEVGCAEGYSAHLIESIFGLRSYVLDLSLEAVKRAQEIYNLKGLVADAQSLECIKTDSFDLVLCSETLEHLPQPQKALKELLRIAKKSLIITVPAAKDYREKEKFVPSKEPHTHLHIFTQEELRKSPFFISLRGISLKFLDKIEGLFTKDGKFISWKNSQCLVILYRFCRILFFPLRMLYRTSMAKIFIRLDYLLGKVLIFNAISYMALYQKLSPEFKKKVARKDILNFMLKQDKVRLHLLNK